MLRNPVNSLLELTGAVSSGLEKAANTAIGKAYEQCAAIVWFTVIDTREHDVVKGEVAHRQDCLMVGLALVALEKLLTHTA